MAPTAVAITLRDTLIPHLDTAQCSTLGIATAGHAALFTAWPNPALNELHIRIPDDEQLVALRLFNALGEQVTAASLQPTMDVSALPRGFYFLQVVTERQTVTLNVCLH